MKGAPITSGLEDIAGGIVVFPVVVIIVVGVVVISIVVVAKRVRGFATLFDYGKVEGDNNGNGNDNNAYGDRDNDELAFRFARRGINVTFLLEVPVAPAGGEGPGGKVGIMGVILVWNGRVTRGFTVCEGVQRVDGRRVVGFVNRGRDSE